MQTGLGFRGSGIKSLRSRSPGTFKSPRCKTVLRVVRRSVHELHELPKFLL